MATAGDDSSSLKLPSLIDAFNGLAQSKARLLDGFPKLGRKRERSKA